MRHPIVKSEDGTYQIPVGRALGGLHDACTAQAYLNKAGLIQGHKDPYMEYGIGTNDGHIELGFGDGEGGFNDRAVTADNASMFLHKPVENQEDNLGFELHVNFGDRPVDEIVAGIDQAITLAKQDRKKTLDEKAKKEADRATENTLDEWRDEQTAISQKLLGRTEEEDVQLVTDFITGTVSDAYPGAVVKVSYNPRTDGIIESVYKVQKATGFKISIEIPEPESEEFDLMADISRVNDVFEQRIPHTRNDFVRISSFRGNTFASGEIKGSAARIAAELQNRVPTP